MYASKKAAGIHVNTPRTCPDEHGETRMADVTSNLSSVSVGTHNSLELKFVIRAAPIRVINPEIPTQANSNQTFAKKILFPAASTKITGKIRSNPIAAMAIR